MNNSKFLFVIFFIFQTIICLAQNQKEITVRSFEVKDEITVQNPIDPTVGRYVPYELTLHEGDYLGIELHSKDFLPSMLLISPMGEKYFEIPQNSLDFIRKVFQINASGKWDLYIISDTSNVGEFYCNISFSTSLHKSSLNSNSVCNFIKNISEHAKANYIFLDNNSDADNFTTEIVEYNKAHSSKKQYKQIVKESSDKKELTKSYSQLVKKITGCGSFLVKQSEENSDNTRIENSLKSSFWEFTQEEQTVYVILSLEQSNNSQNNFVINLTIY